MEVGAEGFAWRLPRLRRRILRAAFVGERRGRLSGPSAALGPRRGAAELAPARRGDPALGVPQPIMALLRPQQRAPRRGNYNRLPAEAGKGAPSAVLAWAGGRGS